MPVIAALLWFSLLAVNGGGADASQWRLVDQDGSVTEAAGEPHLAAAQAARLRSAWVWSATRAPRRVAPSDLARAERELASHPDAARLALQVVRKASVRPPADLRLVAAPIDMWMELPEGSLPSWPIPADGRVRVPVDGVRRWRVRVASSTEGSWWADAKPNLPALAVQTSPAAGIDLAVEDERGRPLGSVGGSVGEGTARVRDSRTWAALRGNGRLASPGLPDAQEVALEVVQFGYQPAVVRGWPSALPHELRLRPGATLSGRVGDAAGKPLPGVAVEAEAWAQPQAGLLMHYRAVSGPHGEWTVQGVPPGRVALSLRKPGFVPRLEQLRVDAGATDTGLRQLDHGGQLQVLLRDAVGPVPRARIEGGPGLSAVADGRGIAVLQGVPLSALTLKANEERHQLATLQINPPFPAQVVITLPRAFTVTGRFVDRAGTPVASGVARIEMPGCSTSARLGDDGHFAMTLVPGKQASLILRGPQVRELTTSLAPGEPGEVRDLGDLSPPPGIDVTGRVISGQDGTPVAGARVWLPRPGPEGPTIAWANRDVLETSTDPAGAFRLSGLDQGGTRLRIDAAGFARAQADVTALDPAAPGGVVDLGDLTVQPGTRLHVLVRASGRSTDDSLEGATARVDLGNLWLDPDMLQADVHGGEAVVPNVPAGPVTVSVLAANKLVCDKQLTVTGDASDMDVDCTKKTITVTGTVKLGTVAAGAGSLIWRTAGAAAAPPSDSQIDNVDSPGGLRQQQVFGLGIPQVDAAVDPDSRFATQDLSPGTWTVSWSSRAGALSGPLTVDIPDQEAYATQLVFPGLAVTGTVTTKDGKPAAGARVRELLSGDMVFAGDDGTFTLAGLQPGAATLQAQQGDLTSRPLHLEVPADGTLDPVQLVVTGDADKITIQVLSTAGTPVAGAFVFLQEQGGNLRLLTTTGDGTATASLDGDEPPAVRAAAYAGGIWTLGPWTPWDAAQQGLSLASGPAGRGALVVTSAQGAAVKLLSADGWDLSWLYQYLGAPLQAAPAKPLEIQGLPAGAYAVSAGGNQPAVPVSVPDAGSVAAQLNE
jgi:hypothetical protein